MTQQDSTQVTFSQVYSDLKGALNGAADALKVGAEHIYEVLVRQQIVNSVTLLIIYIALGFFSYYAWKLTQKHVVKNSNEYRHGDWGALYIIPSVVTVVVVAVFATTFNQCVTGFLNPEYNAIMEIKGFIR